jgi:cysteinyl-tRNA synthetase
MGRSDGSGFSLGLTDGSGYGDPLGDGEGGGYGGGDASFSVVAGALADDLNTPLAFAAIHAMENAYDLQKSLGLLGIDLQSYAELIERRTLLSVDKQMVETQIAARLAARKAKNFKEADRIRDELLAQSIVLKDGPDGTTWELKR